MSTDLAASPVVPSFCRARPCSLRLPALDEKVLADIIEACDYLESTDTADVADVIAAAPGGALVSWEVCQSTPLTSVSEAALGPHQLWEKLAEKGRKMPSVAHFLWLLQQDPLGHNRILHVGGRCNLAIVWDGYQMFVASAHCKRLGHWVVTFTDLGQSGAQYPIDANTRFFFLGE